MATAKIYDTFTFYGGYELPLLECRLRELDAVVDVFVIVEATVRQSDGIAKMLWLADNWERFRPWHRKIRYVIADDLPGGPDPWARETAQRNQVMTGLYDAAPDDLILFGDLDEIPRPASVLGAYQRPGPSRFLMNQVFFAVDWFAPWPWTTGTASVWMRDMPASISQIRLDAPGYPNLDGAGWHLAWLGGPEAIQAKAESRCHTDETAEITAHNQAGKLYEGGWVWHSPRGGGQPLVPADVDQSWPQWIYQRRCPKIWFRPREAEGATA